MATPDKTPKTPRLGRKKAAPKAAPAPIEPDAPAAEVPFPSEQVVITGTINIVLDDHDSMGGSRFPVESKAERIDGPKRPEPPEMAVFPVENDEQRARRLEKESMSRGERLKRGW